MALPAVGGGYQYTDGNISEIKMVTQAPPATVSTSATLTTDQLATQLIVIDQGAGSATSLTLPTGTLMDSAFGNIQVNKGFDISFCNIGDGASEDATIVAGTGWTLYNSAVIASNNAATDRSAATFRAVKTGTATWSLYRIAG